MQLPGSRVAEAQSRMHAQIVHVAGSAVRLQIARRRTEDETEAAQPPCGQAGVGQFTAAYHCIQAFADHIDEPVVEVDRKSTRLNSSHSQISYAVFCLKKKKKKQ